MKLSEIVPWGRTLKEYREMFLLSDHDLKKTILGCADGPACFNTELTKIGGNVKSLDPIYQYTSAQIRTRIEKTYPQVMAQVEKNIDDYVWNSISSTEELGQIRMEAMNKFLTDYETGKNSGRYIYESLPVLSFENNSFELALCSHYLFLYSDHVDKEQHIASIKELCRVAKEVRVYPLLSLDSKKSKHLQAVILSLTNVGFEVSQQQVKYEFQKGATEMLVVKSC